VEVVDVVDGGDDLDEGKFSGSEEQTLLCLAENLQDDGDLALVGLLLQHYSR
jgi:hypothetical protein